MAKRFAAIGMRIFILVWFGQLVSLIGSGLTEFAMGIWVYQRTGSATQFALISLFASLPSIIISPVAGVLVDRWNRRWAMILSDSGAGLGTGVIALLLVTNNLEIWHIYIATAVISTFKAIQWPAYSAATTLLVPKQHLGRVSGMTQFGEAFTNLISPVLGGLLLITIKLQGVVLVDLLTFLFSVSTLLSVKFPNVKNTDSVVHQGNLLKDATYGWTYITKRKGLLGLLVFFAADNFLVGIAMILLTPLVLSFTSATVLSSIWSIGGVGMIAGSLVLSTWGAPQRLIYSILGFELLTGLCILVSGLYTSVPLLAVAAFILFFSLAITNGCSQVIWQKKVAPDVQGRVFAVRGMIAGSFQPLAYLVAGSLADYIFEPLLTSDGLLANSIGQIIGTGPGRGIGLLFMIMGVLTMLATVAAYRYPHLRLVEDELPDALADEVVFTEN